MIRTARLLLREWTEADRAPFAAINADPQVMEFMPKRLSREESDVYADRIEKHFKQHRFGLWAAESRGKFIGFIGLSIPGFEAHFTPCVEIGWRLASEFWRQGLATEGARAVVRYAFETLGLRELNRASELCAGSVDATVACPTEPRTTVSGSFGNDRAEGPLAGARGSVGTCGCARISDVLFSLVHGSGEREVLAGDGEDRDDAR